MSKRAGIIAFVSVIQCILFLTHFFIYKTWTFAAAESEAFAQWLKVTVGVLSVSFLAASLLAFRYTSPTVRTLYRIAAVWLGIVSFLFFAAGASWVVFGATRLAGADVNFHAIVEVLYAAAVLSGVAGLLNAGWTRIRWITVRLENLPETWRGRTAALVSDLHLGHVRNGGFLRRIVRKVMRENPDAVFLAGDLYDGTAIDAAKAAEPLRALRAPQGTYFVAGNHEQFGDDSRYLQAVSSAGVRVLHNEKVDADQLQIVGVPYNHATHDEHFQKVLRLIGVDRNRASILLTHAPDRPHIAEKEGISLQVSGHTHVGQFFPWTWMARRIYRQFVYGLSRIGKMLVYTSSGAGTWGPPLRLGSSPEIVFFQFE
ncbi:MAG TPA: metallophosphoesterase [Candidatus Polarisedimenticolia bacterium]|nr:metallophosphoesterase [Candidatus Polarisedimenticolia bacterium]